MRNLKKVAVLVTIITVFSSCFFDRKPKDVDSFYTKKNYLDFPAVPLVKPIFIHYNKAYDKWFFNVPDYFKKLYIENLNKVGVDKSCIYGKLITTRRFVEDYKNGDHVYMYADGSITWTKNIKSISDSVVKITSFDTLNKSFTEPQRWFAINVLDSTAQAFFSKRKYDNYLKEKGISGKMYNINKYQKQYKETGILPWFPDSIKVKLKK